MKHLFFWIMTVCFSSCNNFNGYSDDEKAADLVSSRVFLKLKKEKELHPFGTGGQMMNEIEMLALAFNYYKPLNIEEARELLVYAVDKFVAEINSDEKIRPYLANYPFVPKNVDIQIFIHNPDGSDVKPGELAILTISWNELAYSVKCEEGDMRRYVTIHEESYGSALEELSKLNKKSA